MSNGWIMHETEISMPNRWDPGRYEQRAKEWRDRAASLPEGRERDACVTIAEGYERLAEIHSAAQHSRRTQKKPRAPGGGEPV